MAQPEMFPDMPYEQAEGRVRHRTAKPVWFYVQHTKSPRMLSFDPYDGSVIFIPLDLACPRIALFSVRRTARDYADRHDGEVVKYPYNLDHFYSR